MYCRICGTELRDSDAFCRKCGTKVVAEMADSTAVDSAPASNATVVSAPADSAPAAKRPTKWIALCVAAVVAVACIGAGIWWKSDQDAKAAKAAAEAAAWAAAHAEQPLSFVIEAPNFDPSATSIPVRIVGTDLDGNTVNTVEYLSEPTSTIHIIAGSYDVDFPGGYFTAAGEVMRAPQTSTHVEIPTPTTDGSASTTSSSSTSNSSSNVASSSSSSDVTSDNSSSGSNTTSDSPNSGSNAASSSESQAGSPIEVKGVAFAPVPALEVTDEMLQEIYDLAAHDSKNNGKADALRQAATDIRNAAVAAEEERKRVEALTQAAFGSFPRSFVFTSGVGAWSTNVDVQQDGTFTGNWHDADMGVRGSDYPKGSMSVCDFAGKFTVVDQLSDTEFLLQLDYLQPTQPAGVTIENGMKIERYDDQPYGLGKMTDTPIDGWRLYLPGQSTASFSEDIMRWLYPGGTKYRESTLSKFALVNASLGYALFTN